jgi:hypothetical protein
MKLSTYHKCRGDEVRFAKGCLPELRMQSWDRIYVSSLFTYHWKETVQTIWYYQHSVPSKSDVVVGGVLATLLRDELVAATGATVISGLLDKPGILDDDDKTVIDCLVPDYSILDEVHHNYKLKDSYLGYATRGCPRHCAFCAVREIEPHFVDYLPLKRQINLIDELFGPKKNLVLLDNNVLASNQFERIIEDIKGLGFEKGATFSYTNKGGRKIEAARHVDFNQGLDMRLMTEEKTAKLGEIALHPARIAFDDVKLRKLYEEKVRLAAKYKIRHLSNYVLYNYQDHPRDFYERLRINIELNEGLGLQIFSFPMRYIDLRAKTRSIDEPGNLGKHWNRKFLRAVQCILIPTRGLVGTRKSYFEAAFGRDLDDFKKILLMPEAYIVDRNAHEEDGSTDAWWASYQSLTESEREICLRIVFQNDFSDLPFRDLPRRVNDVMRHYAPVSTKSRGRHHR